VGLVEVVAPRVRESAPRVDGDGGRLHVGAVRGLFARGTIVLEAEDGRDVVIEASTSWAYVGPWLRVQIEVLGPEYAMEIDTLSNQPEGVSCPRAVTGSRGRIWWRSRTPSRG
jgi:hypothetical protein